MTARRLAESRLPLPLLRRGQGARGLRGGRRAPAARRQRPGQRVRRRDARADPHKGAVLTQITAFWFERLAGVVPSHYITARTERDLDAVPALADAPRAARGPRDAVRRTEPVPFECVVRGYLSGSAWKEYRAIGHAGRRAACRRAARERAARPAALLPGHQGGDGPRREHHRSTRWPRALGPESARPAARRELRGVPAPAATTRPRAGSSSPTPSSSSASTPTARSC